MNSIQQQDIHPKGIHPIEWTSQQVQTFWNWYATRPEIQRSQNAVVFASNVLAFARKHVPQFGVAIDYASGLGALTQQLVAQGVQTWALDVSEASVQIVDNLLRHQPAFLGAHRIGAVPTPLENNCADTVFLIETIEHLKDDALAATMREVRRLLRAGGHLIITTPNEENLAASNIVCPNCLCEFHRGQHVRAWSAQSLKVFVAGQGFAPLVCAPTYFADRAGVRGAWHALRLRAWRRPLPHLALVAQRL
jgi:2-polyprenyl-3-methyl-5-hydroxy-6-metoxy-1,4-benzoquinol methylase